MLATIEDEFAEVKTVQLQTLKAKMKKRMRT